MVSLLRELNNEDRGKNKIQWKYVNKDEIWCRYKFENVVTAIGKTKDIQVYLEERTVLKIWRTLFKNE